MLKKFIVRFTEKPVGKQLISAIRKGQTQKSINLANEIESEELNDTKDSAWNTPLMWAAYFKQEKICEILISKMSDKAINAVSLCSYTALTQAATQDLTAICEMLIPKMDPKIIDIEGPNGDRAFDIAAKHNNHRIMKMINCHTAHNYCNASQDSGDAITFFVVGSQDDNLFDDSSDTLTFVEKETSDNLFE
jgi:Ankyrin repeat